MAFSIRLTEDERILAESYARLHSFSLSEAFKRALFEKIEDEYDIMIGQEAYNEYEKLKHLQLEYIENHEILTPGVVCVTYSNGESILVNYNSTSAKVRGITVPAQDYRIVGVK